MKSLRDYWSGHGLWIVAFLAVRAWFVTQPGYEAAPYLETMFVPLSVTFSIASLGHWLTYRTDRSRHWYQLGVKWLSWAGLFGGLSLVWFGLRFTILARDDREFHAETATPILVSTGIAALCLLIQATTDLRQMRGKRGSGPNRRITHSHRTL